MTKKNSCQKGKVYIVQKILDIKVTNGVPQFRVKWKGYPNSECTWQPEKSFNCSKATFNQFLEERAQESESFKQKLSKINKQLNIYEVSNKQKIQPIEQKVEKNKKDQKHKIINQNKSQQSQSQIQESNDDLKQAQIEKVKKTKQIKKFGEPHVKIPKQFKILSIKYDAGSLKFYVMQNGKNNWKLKEEMHKNYAKQLCMFYEQHLTFDV